MLAGALGLCLSTGPTWPVDESEPVPRLAPRLRQLSMRRFSGHRIHVLGGGAIGQLIAHELASAGHAITLLTRNPTDTRATLRIDYTVTSTSRTSRCDLEKSSGDGLQQPIECLISTVKAFDLEPALRALQTRLTADTGIVLVHNGLLTQPVDELLPTVAPENVFDSCTRHAVYVKSPPPHAHSVLGAPGELAIGPFAPSAQGVPSINAKRLTDALTQCEPLEAVLLGAKDYYRVSRAKLGVNAPYNASTCIFNVWTGDIAKPEPYRHYAKLIIDELAAVYEAERIAQNLGDPEPALQPDALLDSHLKALLNVGNSYSSTLQDVRNGKRIEISYINGSVCALGRRYGVPTPCNELMAHLAELRSELGSDSFRF